LKGQMDQPSFLSPLFQAARNPWGARKGDMLMLKITGKQETKMVVQKCLESHIFIIAISMGTKWLVYRDIQLTD